MNNQSLPTVGAAEVQATTPVQVSVREPENHADEFAVPYRLLHHALRGRYAMALILGVVLGAMLAWAGWNSTKLLYRSESLLRIPYDPPRLNQPTVDTRSIEAFEAYMQSQQTLLTSDALLREALKDPAWKEHGYPSDNMIPEQLAGDLSVQRRAGTETIKVSYLSDDQVKAMLAVETVVNAYVKMYHQADKQTENEKAAALEQRQQDVAGQIKELETRRNSEAVDFGSATIGQFYDAAVARLTRVESQLIDVRIAMALAGTPRPGDMAGTLALRTTPEQIARFDGRMAKYLQDREDAESRLQELRLRGLGEEHRDVVMAKKAVEGMAKRIQDYALQLQRMGADVPPAAAGQAAGLAGQSLETLKIQEQNVIALAATAKQQMLDVGAKKMRIDGMNADIDKLRTQLDDINQRIRAMEMEAGLSGRLSVMSKAEVPVVPAIDHRQRYAIAGAVGGFFLPAGLLVLYGILYRRYRYSDDAADDMSANLPLLGILPQLPERLSDVEMAADAAQCLHQIRVMLQVQSQTTGSVCYLMTSACPGEGKTSLTAALALSFAAAGARTLVIDADLIGQRLTRGYRLDDRPGLREAMQRGFREGMICESGVPGLFILPAGISDGRDACAFSHKTLRRILASAREQYDIVLIDSGPILGSIEAMVVAGLADAVVLTVSRQQQKPLVDRALRQLRAANARIAGLVFNKAEHRDFRRSVGVSSLRSISANADSGALVRAGVTSTSGFGSLVDSVQTYLPAAG